MKGYIQQGTRWKAMHLQPLEFSQRCPEHIEKTAIFNKRYWENWLTTLPHKKTTQILASLNLHKNQFQMDPGPQSKT